MGSNLVPSTSILATGADLYITLFDSDQSALWPLVCQNVESVIPGAGGYLQIHVEWEDQSTPLAIGIIPIGDGLTLSVGQAGIQTGTASSPGSGVHSLSGQLTLTSLAADGSASGIFSARMSDGSTLDGSFSNTVPCVAQTATGSTTGGSATGGTTGGATGSAPACITKNGSCNAPGGCCEGLSCSNVQSCCVPNGGACQYDFDCCASSNDDLTNTCILQYGGPSVGTCCQQPGTSCTGATACGGLLGCDGGLACYPSGTPCQTASDCCSGSCEFRPSRAASATARKRCAAEHCAPTPSHSPLFLRSFRMRPSAVLLAILCACSTTPDGGTSTTATSGGAGSSSGTGGSTSGGGALDGLAYLADGGTLSCQTTLECSGVHELTTDACKCPGDGVVCSSSQCYCQLAQAPAGSECYENCDCASGACANPGTTQPGSCCPALGAGQSGSACTSPCQCLSIICQTNGSCL